MYRALDANINRIAEGLRVVEDYLRFEQNDKKYIKIKEIRHFIREKITKSIESELLTGRLSITDVGNKPDNIENNRENIKDLLKANFLRAEEGFRVLEESAKLIKKIKKYLPDIKKYRFFIYNIEKEVFTAIFKKIDFETYIRILIKTSDTDGYFKILSKIKIKKNDTAVEIKNSGLAPIDFLDAAVKFRDHTFDHNIKLFISGSFETALLCGADGIVTGNDYYSAGIIKNKFNGTIGYHLKNDNNNGVTDISGCDFITADHEPGIKLLKPGRVIFVRSEKNKIKNENFIFYSKKKC